MVNFRIIIFIIILFFCPFVFRNAKDHIYYVTSMGIDESRKSQNTKSVERYNLLLQFPTKKRQINVLTRKKTEQISTYFRKTEFNPVYNLPPTKRKISNFSYRLNSFTNHSINEYQ